MRVDCGQLALRDRKFADSSLEGDGFELLVPQHESPGFPKHPGAELRANEAPEPQRIYLSPAKSAGRYLARYGHQAAELDANRGHCERGGMRQSTTRRQPRRVHSHATRGGDEGVTWYAAHRL